MTDDERARIERLSRSIDLTLADAQDRIDRGETLPFECARAVVKVAKAAVELCHAHPDALSAARAEALEEAAVVAERFDSDRYASCRQIGDAIRALPAARRGQ